MSVQTVQAYVCDLCGHRHAIEEASLSTRVMGLLPAGWGSVAVILRSNIDAAELEGGMQLRAEAPQNVGDVSLRWGTEHACSDCIQAAAMELRQGIRSLVEAFMAKRKDARRPAKGRRARPLLTLPVEVRGAE